MSDFNEAIKLVLKHEGGFVNNPNDPGGATNYGISLATLQEMKLDLNNDGTIDISDELALTPDMASNIYETVYWDNYNLSKINSQRVANKLFDIGVNCGMGKAIRMLQEAIGIPVTGEITDAVVSRIDYLGEQQVIDLFKQRVTNFYKSIVDAHPPQAEFLNGWLNRVEDEQV